MLSFGLFLRGSARTAAKSRTNLSSHRRSCRKPLDRSGPKWTHASRFIWEWTSAKKINLSRPMVIWRGLGDHTFKNVGKMSNSCTDRDQIWHTYAYSSGNGHEQKIKPLIPEVHGWGGGFRGSSIHKSGKTSKPLDRSVPNLAYIYRITREWT